MHCILRYSSKFTFTFNILNMGFMGVLCVQVWIQKTLNMILIVLESGLLLTMRFTDARRMPITCDRVDSMPAVAGPLSLSHSDFHYGRRSLDNVSIFHAQLHFALSFRFIQSCRYLRLMRHKRVQSFQSRWYLLAFRCSMRPAAS